jgi:signal transduction histidine kinase
MEQMVGNALDLVRGLERQEPLESIDVPALLDAIAEEARLGGASVHIVKKPTKPYTGRPQALRRCFVNLVENAVKYGGSVQIDVNDTPTAMEIRIRDRGPGIPEGELEKVFAPFYRLEASRSRDTGGTGLGLTIARNIVRAHKGELVLRNMPEGGLEAIVTLPR